MGLNLKIGQIIPLAWQLHDGATNKFPQAVIRDKDDVPISGSPFDLTHQSNGLYTLPGNAALMPNSEKVTVQFLTYNESGHTTLSDDHSIVTLEIALDTSSESDAGEISAVVESTPIVNGIVSGDSIKGIIDEC